MAFLIGGANSAADTGYDIDNSLRFNDGDTAYLSRTPSSSGSRTIATVSFWVKRSELGDESYLLEASSSTSPFNMTRVRFSDSDELIIDNTLNGSAANGFYFQSDRLYRDVSAWYHIFFSIDVTEANATDGWKLYVNGVQQTKALTYWVQNANLEISQDDVEMNIGRRHDNSTDQYDGYLAEYHYIDGTIKAYTDFGEFDEDSGIWKPKEYTGGSYGTNGFFLEFKETGTNQDSSGIGADTSGEDNHLAVTNLAATDQTTDTPTNNFATLRIAQAPANSTVVLTEGNCDFDYTQDGSNARDGQNHCVSNIAMSSGKWYMECKVLESVEAVVGIVNMSRRAYDAEIQNWYGVYLADGRKVVQDYTGQSVVYSTYGSAFSTDDIVMVALDMDNKNIYWGKDGSWGDGSGNFDEASPHTAHAITTNFLTVDGDGENVVFSFFSNSSGASPRFQVNFGNPHFSISSGNADANGYGNFEFAVPTNYYALCTKNLAEYG